MKTIAIILAVTATLAAGPASAQSFLKKLTSKAAERVERVIETGELPRVGSGEVNPNSQGVYRPMTSGTFQRYGGWEFRLDALELGVDDQWQAVIGVRNAQAHRQGMVASEIKLALITEDGETRSSWGEIYKASVEGASVGLEPVGGTLWLEPGDTTRIRLRFDGSRGLKPAKIRIASTGATAESRTFPVDS